MNEIISQALDRSSESAVVHKEYMTLISRFGSELKVLLDCSAEKLAPFVSEKTLDGILRMREGKIEIIPGYDGEYGKIKIFDGNTKNRVSQIGLF